MHGANSEWCGCSCISCFDLLVVHSLVLRTLFAENVQWGTSKYLPFGAKKKSLWRDCITPRACAFLSVFLM